jgi:5'(3')-deoxyribonucleotidase
LAQINCDVDGVVCGFVPGLFEKLQERGFAPKPIDDPVWGTWDIFERMSKEMRNASFAVLAEPDFWSDLPVVPYAQEAIRDLRAAGHHIQWVTTAWNSCFGWYDARRNWLDKNFASPDQNLSRDLTVTGSKGLIWADVYIDDKPAHIVEWHEHHSLPEHRAILYKTYFNVDSHGDLDHIEWSPESVANILDWLDSKYQEG